MKREWKPGDVAMVELPEGSERPAVLIGVDTGCLCWHSAVSGDFRCLDFDAVAVRPLAVIDPENREQVERLLIAYYGRLPSSEILVEKMQAALRSAADPKPPKPPKLEEPTGLGAVVEDTEGVRWVRRSTHPARSWSADTGSFQRAADYADIDAVRVLSEGVTP